MAKLANGQYTFNMHIDKDLMMFLKQTSMKQEISMKTLVSKCISDYKNKIEKKHRTVEDFDDMP